MQKINFVVVELGDNDFGHTIAKGLRELVDSRGGIDFCPITAKRYLIEFVASKSRLRCILDGREDDSDSVRKYLEKMRVTFRNKLPSYDMYGDQQVDHDSGSACYDVNLDSVFTF